MVTTLFCPNSSASHPGLLGGVFYYLNCLGECRKDGISQVLSSCSLVSFPNVNETILDSFFSTSLLEMGIYIPSPCHFLYISPSIQ